MIQLSFSTFDINLLNRKQYKEETGDDYMARMTRLTACWDHYLRVKIRIATNRNASKSRYFRES